MWIEILKILAPSAVTAIILGYWFNKKLEKQKMFLRIQEMLLNSLITGLHLLMNDYKAIMLKVEEIKAQIRMNSLDYKSVDELRDLKEKYEATLRIHRIHLSALVPYGGTGPKHSHDDVNLVAVGYILSFLKQLRKADNTQAKEICKTGILKAIDYASASYDSVCDKANLIINHLQDGKNPFVTHWESNSNSWKQIAAEMMRELASVDLQIHFACKDNGI